MVLVADLVEEVVEVEAVTATTVVSRVTCHATAQSRALVAAAAVAAIVPATTVVRVDTSPATARTRWVVVEVAERATVVVTVASATTVMRLDISLVTARMLTGVAHRTEAAWSASDATRLVTSLVTARTAAEVAPVADLVVVVVAVAAALTCAATTAMKSDTSLATVRQQQRSHLPPAELAGSQCVEPARAKPTCPRVSVCPDSTLKLDPSSTCLSSLTYMI